MCVFFLVLFLKKKDIKWAAGVCVCVCVCVYIYTYIQGVTGPHRQNDRDDRPCREDHFL